MQVRYKVGGQRCECWCVFVPCARRSLLTDEYLRVKGSDGSIWAFGDAATIDQPRALQRADELFEQADVDKVRRQQLTGATAPAAASASFNGGPAGRLPATRPHSQPAAQEAACGPVFCQATASPSCGMGGACVDSRPACLLVPCLPVQNGRVSLEELQRLMEAASKEYSHFEEHAKFLERKNSRYCAQRSRTCPALLCTCSMCQVTGGHHHQRSACSCVWLTAGLPACLFPPRWIGRHTGAVRKLLGGGSESSPVIDTLQTLEEDTELSKEEFRKLLETIDSGLRALPATAQVRASSRLLLARPPGRDSLHSRHAGQSVSVD
jgi:hypothetical protein